MEVAIPFSGRLLRIAALASLSFSFSAGAYASQIQQCTHVLHKQNSDGTPYSVVDLQYYEDNHYKIARITISSPFGFFFLVKQRLQAVQDDLPIKAGDDFSKKEYDVAANEVGAAVREDSAFGQESPFKFVYSDANLVNCDEREAHKTVDVAYYVVSTDPIPALRPKPEGRATSTEQNATEVADRNTQGPLKLTPLSGYTPSLHGFGGGEMELSLPSKSLENFRLRGTGSSNTLLLNGELNGSSNPHQKALDTLDYHLAYNYMQSPTQTLSLKIGSGQVRFTGVSQQLGSTNAQTRLRYGLSLEQGLQQSNVPGGVVLPDTITNSRYGALRLYTGITASTRYSETIASYGLDIGGAGLDNLDYIKQIGDETFSLRFPGGTHSPWDLQARVTGGGISGGPILLNDRFFGGNVVAPFIPGDSWLIPNGPLVRSITANYLNGTGYGGTSFYSTNLTVGKVIKNWPMIPDWINNSPDFSNGIVAAENTTSTVLISSYLASSDVMQKLLKDYPDKLNRDVVCFQAAFKQIRKTVALPPQLERALSKEETEAKLAQRTLANVDGERLRQLYGSSSRFTLLLNNLPPLLKLLPDDLKDQLDSCQKGLSSNLKSLKQQMEDLDNGPAGADARARAKAATAHTNQVIDTLRHEANMFALGLFGIFDTGRLWPDPNGTRYAFGGGVRLSVVNVNFSLGYAANPNPLPKLHQGNGTVLFVINYTNLF